MGKEDSFKTEIRGLFLFTFFNMPHILLSIINIQRISCDHKDFILYFIQIIIYSLSSPLFKTSQGFKVIYSQERAIHLSSPVGSEPSYRIKTQGWSRRTPEWLFQSHSWIHCSSFCCVPFVPWVGISFQHVANTDLLCSFHISVVIHFRNPFWHRSPGPGSVDFGTLCVGCT